MKIRNIKTKEKKNSYFKLKRLKNQQNKLLSQIRLKNKIKKFLDNFNFFFIYIILFNILLFFYDLLIKNDFEFNYENKTILLILFLLILFYFLFIYWKQIINETILKNEEEYLNLEKKKSKLVNKFFIEFFGNKSDLAKTKIYKIFKNKKLAAKNNFLKIKKEFKINTSKLNELKNINKHNFLKYHNIKDFKWCGICNYNIKIISKYENCFFFNLNKRNNNFNNLCSSKCLKKILFLIKN